MRITKSNIEYYLSLLNGKLDYPLYLDIAYGGYKLLTQDNHEVVPYRMTARECYYVVYGMYNNICNNERIKYYESIENNEKHI